MSFDYLEFIECSFLDVDTVDGHSRYFFWSESHEHREEVDVGIGSLMSVQGASHRCSN